MTESELSEFVRAWARRDADAVMAWFTDDCTFSASMGPEPGATYVGRIETSRAVTAALANMSGEFRPGRCRVFGAFGVAEWTMISSAPDGRSVSTRGCDLFEFQGGKISSKDAFRKVLGP